METSVIIVLSQHIRRLLRGENPGPWAICKTRHTHNHDREVLHWVSVSGLQEWHLVIKAKTTSGTWLICKIKNLERNKKVHKKNLLKKDAVTKEFLALKAFMSHSWDLLVITWRLHSALGSVIRSGGMEEPFRYQFGGVQHQASLGLLLALTLQSQVWYMEFLSPFAFWSVSPYASVSQKFQTCIFI